MPEASGFIRALAEAMAVRPLDAKLLVAPSERVGRQWLDRAAAFGAAANARPTSLERVMRDLAGEAMQQAGLSHPREPERLAIIHDLLAGTRRGGSGGYFSGLAPSLAVLRMLDASFADLDRAGVDESRRLLRALAPPAKARELSLLHARFAARLADGGFAWRGAVARMAMAAAEKAGDNLPFLMLPGDLLENLSGLERELWRRWPEGGKRLLPPDAGGTASLSFLAADSPATEAREVFRILFEQAIPLDKAEIVTLGDGGTAAICAAAAEYFPDANGEPTKPEDLPLTFADGVPPYGARPVRLLAAWLDWVGSEQSIAGLAALCGSGLLNRRRMEEKGVSPERLAAFLLSLSADGGAGAIREAVRTADGGAGARAAALGLGAEVLAPLAADPGPRGLLVATRALLEAWGESRGELDAYARRRLLEDPFLSGEASPWPGFDAGEWLTDLAGSIRIMGKGPQPGKLHVSGLDGGHAGRGILFVTGLDDASFPGGDRQDPVLLDRERRRLSDAMPLAADRPARREVEFERLLARAGGRIVLGHARRDPIRGRELFPAEALLAAARSRAEDGREVAERSAAFVPERPDRRHSAREYWLGRGLASSARPPRPAELADFFPGLAEGEKARTARASRDFTVYDGLVFDSGRDYREERPILSATQLECLASCPQEYFFLHVLGLRPPERRLRERGRWLDARDRGSLLHQVFREFLSELRDREVRADYDSHRELLEQIAASVIGVWRHRVPPNDELAYERERRFLMESCLIFLREETRIQKEARPLCLEASFGVAGANSPLPWGDGGAFTLSLPSGRELRLAGTLDRVDRLDAGGLAVWDYKTGRSDAFKRDDPFAGGVKLQAALYAVVLAGMAGQVEPVATSGYFFPTPREGGRRISHGYADLAPVVGLVDRLAGFLEAGSFPFLPAAEYEAHDCLPIFDAAGGVEKLAAEATAKGLFEKS